MSLVLRDILVELNCSNCHFANPVRLVAESNSSASIGYADLEHRSGGIYATLYIENDAETYADCFPKAEVDANSNKIVLLSLSKNPNKDLRIETVMDQELFQSSAGADNAELK